MLYIADEVFFSGTAAEVTPVRSIDRITIGAGRRGPDHREDPERILRHRRRQEAGYAWLAHSGFATGWRALTKPVGLKKGGTLDGCTPPFKVESEENFRAGTGLRPPPPRLTHPPVPRRNLLTFVPSGAGLARAFDGFSTVVSHLLAPSYDSVTVGMLCINHFHDEM